MHELKDAIIARRGIQARNIAKVAAARKLLTCVFYAMRDGPSDPCRPHRTAGGRVSRPGRGQRVIAPMSGPRPGGAAVLLIDPAARADQPHAPRPRAAGHPEG